MEVIAELAPVGHPNEIIYKARRLAEVADALTIPEAPLGKALPPSSLVALLVKFGVDWDIDVIPHLKVTDYVERSLLAQASFLARLGVKRIVLLRGDVDSSERICIGSAEEALESLRSAGSLLPRVGALITTRRPLAMVLERLRRPFDFFYVLRPQEDLAKLEEISSIAKTMAKKLYGYIIVGSVESKRILRSILGDQPIISLEELVHVIEPISNLLDGFVVASPLRLSEAIRAIKLIRGLVN
ncbi:MAG: hypothetical protein ABWW69_05825 [Pyrodictiaceae archaeon]